MTEPMTPEELEDATRYVAFGESTFDKAFAEERNLPLLRRLLDENARLNTENERIRAMTKLHRESTARQRHKLEQKLIGWREAAEKAHAELDKVIREAAADKAEVERLSTLRDALCVKLGGVLTIVPQLRRIVGDGTRSEMELLDAVEVLIDKALPAAPEMPRPPAEEAALEYRCRECNHWAPWTDGELAVDNDGVALFWCQNCSAEMRLDSMDSRPQEARGDTDTSPAGSGRGTGITEASGTAQAREEWGVRRRDGRVLSFEDRDDAEAFADGWHGGEHTVVHRFIGPWEPAPSLPVPSTERTTT